MRTNTSLWAVIDSSSLPYFPFQDKCRSEASAYALLLDQNGDWAVAALDSFGRVISSTLKTDVDAEFVLSEFGYETSDYECSPLAEFSRLIA